MLYSLLLHVHSLPASGLLINSLSKIVHNSKLSGNIIIKDDLQWKDYCDYVFKKQNLQNKQICNSITTIL